MPVNGLAMLVRLGVDPGPPTVFDERVPLRRPLEYASIGGAGFRSSGFERFGEGTLQRNDIGTTGFRRLGPKPNAGRQALKINVAPSTAPSFRRNEGRSSERSRTRGRGNRHDRAGFRL